jgi:hypothetical protein
VRMNAATLKKLTTWYMDRYTRLILLSVSDDGMATSGMPKPRACTPSMTSDTYGATSGWVSR